MLYWVIELPPSSDWVQLIFTELDTISVVTVSGAGGTIAETVEYITNSKLKKIIIIK